MKTFKELEQVANKYWRVLTAVQAVDFANRSYCMEFTPEYNAEANKLIQTQWDVVEKLGKEVLECGRECIQDDEANIFTIAVSYTTATGKVFLPQSVLNSAFLH